MGDLVPGGLLQSARGPSGGFRLAKSPKDISLYDVLARFESFLADQRPGPFNSQVCRDEDPCQAHDGWNKVCETLRSYLRRISIQQVSVKRRRRLLPR